MFFCNLHILLKKHQILLENKKKSLEIVKKVKQKITLEPFATKVKEILDKNPGFNFLARMGQVLEGSPESLETGESPNLPAIYSNAPVTSVDVEHAFSTFKDIMSPKRMSLREDHIKDILVIQWNKRAFSTTE